MALPTNANTSATTPDGLAPPALNAVAQPTPSAMQAAAGIVQPTPEAAKITPSVMAGLRRRLLIMLLLPLAVLACVSAWFDYQTAGSAAVQQDQQLERLVRLMAGSVVARGTQTEGAPVVLLAPAIEDFVKDGKGKSAWGLATIDGRILVGDAWMTSPTPSTNEPEFHSEFEGGVTYRIVAQRSQTAVGELVVMLADGSDLRQNWLRSLLLKVLLPNVLLIIAAGLAVNWAVQRALQPLLALKDALENRSPRDLSAINVDDSPEEVRPLVNSLNRLFALVDAQTQTQRRFIADAAHQLRTPLAGLQAQVEAWAQAVNAPNASIYTENSGVTQVNPAQAAIKLEASEINRLRNATRRTSQLANQLLALSRADAQSAGSQPMHSVDLQALCASVLEQQLDAATAKGIDLGLDAEVDASDGHGALIVQGYEWLLRELLTNLCDNALRYTPAGGSVTLRCARDPAGQRGLLLQVCDDGPGIAAHERAHVLERFYRVQGSCGEGTGLGLAIAEEIAHLHGTQLVLEDHNPFHSGDQLQNRGLKVSVWFATTAPITPPHLRAPAFTRGIRAQ
jgi:two-component system, OmpR family, sensor histidine kinase TctE